MDIHEDSGTQNFEDKKPKVMTPEKKDDNQASKGEEEKSDDVKQIGEGGEKKEKKRKRRSTGKNREGGEGYKRYVYKVLKQVHPELGMSAKAMVVLNNYMNDMFDRLADEAAKLAMYTARKTLSSREIQGAVKLVLPGELGKHAMAEGTKAVSNYLSKNAARSNK
ncbi:putative transcription factor Hap3/NF-YB family [Rosa chinensis]|uniref:Putative transcription factor Hap3/NF-YB family n=2 Tax=Rosa chinensis TaxID=74649 RepID=A0A2P6QGM6_ROSCH|nr:putative transcription factor Hap3/NF-YB family [Rosa chinensis]